MLEGCETALLQCPLYILVFASGRLSLVLSRWIAFLEGFNGVGCEDVLKCFLDYAPHEGRDFLIMEFPPWPVRGILQCQYRHMPYKCLT